ncbi:MAG TPA: sugar phosphate isomerase/epimerase [Planctomycetes bacterium]|nr:sugar phosphate isomerase/epimerase [Planctomycetota bacterium]
MLARQSPARPGSPARAATLTFCDVCDAQAIARFAPPVTDGNVHPALPVCNAGVRWTRRRFALGLVAAVAAPGLRGRLAAGPREGKRFSVRYLLASSLYGYAKLEEILPEVRKTGATAIDLWPKVHGNQREQLEEMGEERFRELLRRHDISLGCLTRFDLGPFALQDEMRLAQRLGCHLIVTGSRGPRGCKGDALKGAVGRFVEQMKPHLAVAEQTDVTIAIENHSNSLIHSPDSMKWLVELCPSKSLAIALAPYHLPQDTQLLAELIGALGDRLALFYAWQHGKGCMKKLPKEEELLQMPGRGTLDFKPLLEALRRNHFSGFTEIFMHPVPRGIPILPSIAEVTAEVNRARRYLERCLEKG